jgi:hypothetical protein
VKHASEKSAAMVPIIAGLMLAGEPLAAAPKADKREAEAEAISKAMADCYLKVAADRIEKYLIADPATLAFEKWEDRKSDDCRVRIAFEEGFWLGYQGDGLRYALAEGLFHRRLRTVALNDLDRVKPLRHDRPPYQSKYETFRTRKQREQIAQQKIAAVFLSQMGECVVRTDPASSRALLDSKPLAPEEQRAIETLMPALGRCVDTSVTLELDRASLRGAIALNYLRLAKAPRQPAQEAAE